MTDLSSFTPVADILLVEKSTCRRCGFGGCRPIRVMRLYTSHTGKHEHIMEPRKGTDIPLSIRSTRVIETFVESCLSCWKPTLLWDEAEAIVPEAPDAAPRSLNGTFGDAYQRALARAIATGPAARKQLDSLTRSRPLTSSELESLL